MRTTFRRFRTEFMTGSQHVKNDKSVPTSFFPNRS